MPTNIPARSMAIFGGAMSSKSRFEPTLDSLSRGIALCNLDFRACDRSILDPLKYSNVIQASSGIFMFCGILLCISPADEKCEFKKDCS